MFPAAFGCEGLGDMFDDDGQPNWNRIGGVLALVLVVGAAAVLALGSQVSKVLSTVGASVDPGGVVMEPGDGDSGVGPDSGGAGPIGGGAGDAGSGNVDGDIPLTSISRRDLLIIKTGSLSLEVAGIDQALRGAGEVVGSLGGYAAGSDRSGDGTDSRATVTYRIPAATWEAAFGRLRGLALKVLAEHSATEDVTTKVVDLGARITNLQATERALQAIMDRATVINDVLSVQEELTKVRGQIEELSAQKAHLEEQAAFSTLEVTFSLKPADPVTVEQAGFDPASEVDRASASLVGILQDVAVVGIWFGIVWLPILIVLAIVGVIGFFVVRRLRPAAPSSAG